MEPTAATKPCAFEDILTVEVGGHVVYSRAMRRGLVGKDADNDGTPDVNDNFPLDPSRQ